MRYPKKRRILIKRKWAVLVIIAIFIAMGFFLLSLAGAFAEEANAYVTSTRVSVRIVPDSDADAVVSLSNGEQMMVTDQISNYKGENFYVVRLSSLNRSDIKTVDESGNPLYGYVLKEYVSVGDKAYLTLPAETIIWAWPDSTVAVGQKPKGTDMLVLGRYTDAWGHEWYVVQMQKDAGGSGFVRVEEINQQYITQQPIPTVAPQQESVKLTPQQEKGYLYKGMVACDTLGVRAIQSDDADPIGYIHHGDVVKVLEVGEYFTCIEYTYNGATVPGYVHTMWNKSPTLIQIITGK